MEYLPASAFASTEATVKLAKGGPEFPVKKGTEFPLDETHDRTVTVLLPGEESFELFGADVVQNALFRMARSVFKRGALHPQ